MTRSVLVALSGGVDSSVAAALLVEQGWDVTAATMKLWGGESDTGCCSVSDVDDARRVAQQLGIPFHVFAFAEDFTTHVVEPYVAEHAAGRTPNPCIECNRHLKFDRLLRRAAQLGFDRVATGHHARVVEVAGGGRRIGRGADAAKDQSYVLAMLGPDQLAGVELPIGGLTKDEVRSRAAALGLRTAAKPDSQDVCFITAAGREAFLGDRIPLHPGRVVDGADGRDVGTVEAVELVTVGQRRGLAPGRDGTPRYALDVDVDAGVVTVGRGDDLLRAGERLVGVAGAVAPVAGPVLAQSSAHGAPRPAVVGPDPDAPDDPTRRWLAWAEPERRVAPGQTVALYDPVAVPTPDGPVATVLACGTVR